MLVVIAGGHGKIALALTRMLVARGDEVRSLVRREEHLDELRELGAEPVLCDLEALESEQVAARVGTGDAFVFAAGAGPGSGAQRKLTMDRDGAVKTTEACRANGIDRYLIVSSTGAGNPPDGDDVFSVYLRA
jgi:nucleoside-diphosphate-sugar epimerase